MSFNDNLSPLCVNGADWGWGLAGGGGWGGERFDLEEKLYLFDVLYCFIFLCQISPVVHN